MKPERTWILIADGAQARIWLHERPGQVLRPVDGGEFEAPVPRDRNINADRPGRTFDSAGTGRHALEAQSSPHREAKRAFARLLVEHLGQARSSGDFDRLIIVAPPQMLGDLRPQLSDELKACLRGEIGKDLTQVPQEKLAAHLAPLLNVGSGRP